MHINIDNEYSQSLCFKVNLNLIKAKFVENIGGRGVPLDTLLDYFPNLSADIKPLTFNFFVGNEHNNIKKMKYIILVDWSIFSQFRSFF